MPSRPSPLRPSQSALPFARMGISHILPVLPQRVLTTDRQNRFLLQRVGGAPQQQTMWTLKAWHLNLITENQLFREKRENSKKELAIRIAYIT